ncbi:MAG: hypothetical protein H8E62_04220 [Planctomycetes bacterium]|nr:hypothetical protein [Planctomycetota bacterium]
MKRLPYILMTIFIAILSMCILQMLPDKSILKLILLVFFAFIMMSASAYRLENIGWMSGYAWICLIPFLNLPLIYYCCHLPMNYVVYGKVDLPGKIIRTVFLILSLFPLAVIIAFVIADISKL